MGFADVGIGADMGQQNIGRGPTYRAALAAVIILTALLAAGFVALVYGFVRQYQIYRSGGHASVSAGIGGPPAVIALERGARIVSVQTTSNRLVLQLATSKGTEVEVLDLSSGKLLFRVAAPQP